jgi:hypothetical protein
LEGISFPQIQREKLLLLVRTLLALGSSLLGAPPSPGREKEGKIVYSFASY